MGVPVTDPQTQLNLPAGFRFYPTDEELMVQYLCRKVAGYAFALEIIGEVDLYKFDPWVLPSKAMFGEKEWYFFSPRDRKYPNGSRPNRVAGSGYWKATGTDKLIIAEGRKVGIKKALVFYVGKAPKGTKTNWIMHEYRLLEPPKKNNSQRLDDYVLCRIYKKNSNGQQPVLGDPSAEFSHGSSSSSSSQLDDVMDSFPAADDRFLNFPVTFEPENQKLNLQQYDPGSLDWANSITAFGLQDATPVSHPPPPLDSTAVPPMAAAAFLRSPAYDPQGGTGGQRVEDSLYFQPNSNQLEQSYSDAVDPYLIQYPIPPGSLGFRL